MKRLYIQILIFVCALNVFSQDIHFSQFYSVPVLINPSEAGRIKEDTRFTFLYRTQWTSLNSAFNSTGISTDFVVLPPFLKKDHLGLGVYAANDNLGSGIFKGSTINVSFAYHAKLDNQRRHRLSVGLQGGYTSKLVDNSAFRFGNQYKDFAFIPDIDPNEKMANLSYHFWDGQGGVYYSYVWTPKIELNFGMSAYQLHQPKESVFPKEPSKKTNTLGTRSIYTFGPKIKLNDKISINPQAMYMRQSKAKDMNLGAFAIYTIPHGFPLELVGGMFYRTTDAAIFLLGVRYKAFEFRYSYDLTTSSAKEMRGAKNATNRQVNAHEFVINFYGKLTRKNSREFTMPCGIF